MLKTIQGPGWIRRTIELFSKHWDTVLELRIVVRSTSVKYNRGLFQGDSLLPLLFCLAIPPYPKYLTEPRDIPSAMSNLLCMEDMTDPLQNSVREWRGVARELREAQTERLKSNPAEKSHQGSYHRQVTNRESYVWLSEGRPGPQTEALILAAQDYALHTRRYQIRIQRNSSLQMCRECGKAMETVKHILNMCEPKGFSLYKERNDRAIHV